MAQKKIAGGLIGGAFLIGLIHSSIENSQELFFSWLLLGIWLAFSYHLAREIKSTREFNSPANTASFVLFVPLIALLFAIWGRYTSLLSENLLDSNIFFANGWQVVLALPYIVYALLLLYFCHTKYLLVYMGTRAIDSKKYAIGLSLTIIGLTLFLEALADLPFSPSTTRINAPLLILNIGLAIETVLFIFSRRRAQQEAVRREAIATRANRVNSLDARSQDLLSRAEQREARARERQRQRDLERRREARARAAQRRREEEAQAARQQRQQRQQKQKRKQAKRQSKRKSRRPSQKPKNYKHLRPKTQSLDLEDFRCIFCFDLPKWPEDKNRGYVLCPHCRYPAHLDEFTDWTNRSMLCSRCDRDLPSKYKYDPKVVSTKEYFLAIKSFKEELKKK